VGVVDAAGDISVQRENIQGAMGVVDALGDVSMQRENIQGATGVVDAAGDVSTQQENIHGEQDTSPHYLPPVFELLAIFHAPTSPLIRLSHIINHRWHRGRRCRQDLRLPTPLTSLYTPSLSLTLPFLFIQLSSSSNMCQYIYSMIHSPRNE
jgi:hypothetical protein